KDSEKINLLIAERTAISNKIHKDCPDIEAGVAGAVRAEMAVKIEDALSRRIRLLILDADAAIQSAARVAEIMAEEMGKGEKWVQKELTDFNKTAKKYLIKI